MGRRRTSFSSASRPRSTIAPARVAACMQREPASASPGAGRSPPRAHAPPALLDAARGLPAASLSNGGGRELAERRLSATGRERPVSKEARPFCFAGVVALAQLGRASWKLHIEHVPKEQREKGAKHARQDRARGALGSGRVPGYRQSRLHRARLLRRRAATIARGRSAGRRHGPQRHRRVDPFADPAGDRRDHRQPEGRGDGPQDERPRCREARRPPPAPPARVCCGPAAGAGARG